MNRKEALEKLENYFYWVYGKGKYDEETGQKQKQNLEDIIEYLRQPITLFDFLGWEENVEYNVEYNGIWDRYKIVDNKLYEFVKWSSDWRVSIFIDAFVKLQQAKKIQPEKYNLILKSAYRKLFDLQDNEKYLTINIQDGDVFHSKYSTSNSKYQAQFKLEEIEEIKKKYNIDLCIYDIVEV